MKLNRKIICCVLVIITMTYPSFGMTNDQFFVQSQLFFQQHVKSGLVDYQLIKQNSKLINELADHIAKANLNDADQSEKLAFYINAYNLYVVRNIIDKYPVASPLDISGFFDTKMILVAGEKMTLNDLENNKIRIYKDPRIHFVLVCAALGCPKLANFSYTPEKLEDQLTQQTKRALDDSNFIKTQNKQVLLSEIFKWYRADFGSTDKEIFEFINTYRSKAVPSDAEVAYYEYDWKLNDTK